MDYENSKWRKQKPYISIGVLAVLIFGCIVFPWFIPKDPAYMDLAHCSAAPGREFWFGTDRMGRDIFSMVWHGGRLSLFIGMLAAAVSAGIAILYGAASGLAPQRFDALLMRFVEILLAVPNLLLTVLVQAVLGDADAVSISIAIGITGWFSIAKAVRIEVLKMCGSEYVTASRCMGGGFLHILWKHLAPNFFPSILFMAVMNIRNAIVAESALGFIGMGLPVEVVSWGSMLSLSQQALLNGDWWAVLIPGGFLTAALAAVTDLGNYLQLLRAPV